MTLHLGKQPKTEDKRDFLLSDHLAGLPPVKEPFGHGNTYSIWEMLANGPDPTAPGQAKGGAGDCVVASASNETKIALTDATYTPTTIKEADALFNGSTAISDYSAAGGYDPKTGANDNGLEIRDFLKYRQKTGIIDTKGHRHKVGIYVSVEPHNVEHLVFAMKYFEAVPIGIVVSEAQMNAFNKGGTPVWDYVAGSPELGGHCIPLVGRPDASHYAGVSWAQRLLCTTSFIANACEEAWAYLTPERISQVTGKSYEGASEALLSEYLQLATK